MLSSLMSGDIEDFIIRLLLTLPIVLISLSVHETAHGYVAYKLGDPTAYNLGRLSLNPIKHLDPLGTLSMIAPDLMRDMELRTLVLERVAALEPIGRRALALIKFQSFF